MKKGNSMSIIMEDKMNEKRQIIQAPFASTLMSSIKAAKDYYHNDTMSDAMLFGLSGHAFEVHITNGLGPCAPYTFNMEKLDLLVQENLGLKVFESPSILTKETQRQVKENASMRIKKMLDQNHLVLLSSYEFQLIVDYDQNSFYTTKPWEDAFSITPNMSTETFDGMKDFLTYTKVSKTEKGSLKEGILKSLDYAVSTFETPHTTLDSASGYKAYDFWIEKMNDTNAVGHGNWWTSQVWSESRKMASLFMIELKEYFDNEELLERLSEQYLYSSELFSQLADRKTDRVQKQNLIMVLKTNEKAIIENIKKLLK